MADSKKANPPEPPRKRSRLLRLLLWIGLFGTFAIGGLLAGAYWQRERIIRHATSAIPAPVDIEFGEITFEGASKVTIENLSLSDPDSDTPILTATEAVWDFDFTKLLDKNLGTLALTSPSIHLPPPSPQNANPKSSSPATPLNFSWQKLSVTNGNLYRPATPTIPSIHANFSIDGDEFALDEGKATGSPQSLEIHQLTLGNETSNTRAELANVDLTLTPRTEDGALILTGLQTKGGHLVLSGDSFATTDSDPSSADPTETPPASFPAIILSEASITDLEITLTDYSPQEIERLHTTLSWEAPELKMGSDNPLFGTSSLTLRDTDIILSGEQTSFTCERFDSTIALSSTPTIPAATLTNFTLEHAGGSLISSPELPRISTSGDLTLADIPLDRAIPTSIQRLQLHHLTIAPPEDTDTLPLHLQNIRIKASPSELINNARFHHLEIATADLHLTPESLGSLLTPSSSPKNPSASSETTPFHERLRFDHLLLGSANLHVAGLLENVPDITSQFTITPHPDRGHFLIATDFSAALPGNPLPSYTANSIALHADLDKVWKNNIIDSVAVDSGTLRADPELLTFFQSKDADSKEKPEDPIAPPSTPWSVSQFSVEGTKLSLEGIVPGLPALGIELNTHETDLPLTPGGVLGNARPRRIELANLRIPSIYTSASPVATLDTVFIEFTLDGLLKKHIDSVEIVTPKVFIGQNLFWYTDRYRQDTAKKEGTKADSKEEAWSIGSIAAHGGQIVLAPKGIALGTVSQPFPFSCYTELDNGVLSAKLEIPNDTYTIPDLKLQLIGLHGEMDINLPVEADNNLVETLYVDEVRFREFQAKDAWLSITYDQYGIYATFGGYLYGGYLSGAVNVYINEEYTWDAWVSGTDINGEPISRILTPKYLTTTGSGDFTLVANGNRSALFEATGSFQTKTSGSIHIVTIDDLIASLPDDLSDLSRQLTQIGVEPFQHYQFSEGKGDFKLFGREGTLKANFSGPNGNRNIDLTVHDHRYLPPKTVQNTP